MRHRRAARYGVAALAILTIAGALPQAAAAHSNHLVLVPRIQSGRPVPAVDGYCDTSYRYASNRRPIVYRPTVAWNASTVQVVNDGVNLYVCMRGLPRRGFGQYSRATVTFDGDHSLGALPGSTDFRLTLSESNDPPLFERWIDGAWRQPEFSPSYYYRTATDRGSEIEWTAEFRVALELLGRPGTASTVGFRAHQTSVDHEADTFAWPQDSRPDSPNSWADLFLLAAPTGAATLHVDVSRITQGLEWDINDNAATAYDAIAGKDTLARAQLYTSGVVTPSDVVYTACQVQRTAPDLGPLRLLPVTRRSPTDIANPWPLGRWSGTGRWDCWVPGTFVDQPGTYRFALEIGIRDRPRQLLPLGTRTFVRTADLRLLVYPAVFPQGSDQRRVWDSGMFAALHQGLAAKSRMLPLRSGVGGFDWNGTRTAAAPGLRYSIHPVVDDCSRGTRIVGPDGSCEARWRAAAHRELEERNASMAALDSRDGRRRDRFDYAEILGALATGPTGGQSCWSGQRSYFSTEKPDASGAVVAIQELLHCLGMLRPESPHAKPGDPAHSRSWEIHRQGSVPFIRFTDREEVERVYSDLPPLVGYHLDAFTEGWEWNATRRALVDGVAGPPGMVRGDSGRTARGPSDLPSIGVYRLMGIITVDDAVIVDHAGVTNLPGLALTPEEPESRYRLVFYDAANQSLDTVRFLPPFRGQHHDNAVAGLYVAARLPQGTARVALFHDEVRLWGHRFTANAPTVSNVSVTRVEGNALDVTWESTDADPGSSLRYSVYLYGTGRGPILLSQGLTGKSLRVPLDLMPATSQATIGVEATDGYRTGRGSSPAFIIGPNRPTVAMLAPTADGINHSNGQPFARAIQGEPLRFSAVAYDATTGPLDGSAYRWTSDRDGALGTGDSLMRALSAGTHRITVTATAPSKLGASVSLTVNVLADSDLDGMTDQEESSFPCTVGKNGAVDDADGDGLTSVSELRMRSDPCRADTDGNGIGDGDELARGLRPGGTEGLKELRPRIHLRRAVVDLGKCGAVAAQSLPVITDTSITDTSVPFRVAADASWIRVASTTKSVSITASCTGLAPGAAYQGTVLVQPEDGMPRTVTVRLRG